MKFLTVLFTFLLTAVLWAWEPFLSVSLQSNSSDQVKYVMPHRGLHIKSVSRVEYGQPFFIDVAFVVKNKHSESLAFNGDVTVTAPDGKVKTVCRDRKMGDIPAGSQGVFFRLRAVLSFDSSDAVGKYRVELTARDNTGKVQKMNREVELVKSIVDNSPMTLEKMSEMLHWYYRNPQPGRFFAAWQFYLDQGIPKQQEKEKKNFNPSAMLLSFCEILKLNPQFHDDFAVLTKTAPVKDHVYYAFVIAGLGKDFAGKFQKEINPDIMTLVKRLGGEDPFAVKEITAPFQLDMLWAKFFITGSFEAVKMLADMLSARPVISMADAKKKIAAGQQLTAEERQKLFNSVMQNATLWSMLANLRKNHQLLAFYLETIVKRKLYKDQQEAALIISVFENIKPKQDKKNNVELHRQGH